MFGLELITFSIEHYIAVRPKVGKWYVVEEGISRFALYEYPEFSVWPVIVSVHDTLYTAIQEGVNLS